MSKYLIDSDTLTDIADAIREQTGESGSIQVSQMASQIEAISGGSNTQELTQAEYDALSTAEKNNGTIYFITDSSDTAEVVYSTSERAIGRWIDGSTLYEKTYVFGKSDLYDGTVSVDKISGKINIDRISYGVIFIADTFYTHTKSSGQISTPSNYSIARTDYPFFVRINVTNDGTSNSGYDYLYYEQTYGSNDAYNANNFEVVVTLRYTKSA